MSVIIRLSDLSNHAQEIGIWDALVEMAGLDPHLHYDNDDLEITVETVGTR